MKNLFLLASISAMIATSGSAFAAQCSNADQSIKIKSASTSKEEIYNNSNAEVYLKGQRTTFAEPVKIFYSFNHSPLTMYEVVVNKPVLTSATEAMSVSDIVLCNEID